MKVSFYNGALLNRWSEDDGFGSSDFTFALKDFIDEFIRRKKLPLKTVFEPYLEIVKI